MQLSVKLELQADCFAGIWAQNTQQRGLLEQGDIDSALGAAAAVGDDRLQKQATGHVSPDSFTHGKFGATDVVVPQRIRQRLDFRLQYVCAIRNILADRPCSASCAELVKDHQARTVPDVGATEIDRSCRQYNRRQRWRAENGWRLLRMKLAWSPRESDSAQKVPPRQRTERSRSSVIAGWL